MSSQEIHDAVRACINDNCASCPLFVTETELSCHEALLAAIKAAVEGTEIKCSDPRITHEYGRGQVLHVTLHDEGKEAAKGLIDGYAGGYLRLKVQRG